MIAFIALFFIAFIAVLYFIYTTSAPSSRFRSRYFSQETAEEKGEQGEIYVSNIIGPTIPGHQYVLNNYLIQRDGFSAQIDHILINNLGIFVIETKNYSGQIYGDDTRKQWTQVLNYGRQKNRFYSPVKQNAVHASYIKKLIPNIPIFPIVVFVQDNTQHINSRTTIPVSRLKSTIANGTPALNPAKMQSIYMTLLKNQSTSTNEDHVAHIQEKAFQLSNGICPRCGGKLVERNGQHGVFYGCSNYPKCKFTQQKRPNYSNNNYFPPSF